MAPAASDHRAQGLTWRKGDRCSTYPGAQGGRIAPCPNVSSRWSITALQGLCLQCPQAAATPHGPADRHPGPPLRDLRISVTDRCNFRCNYCMPKDVFDKEHAFLPHSALLSFEEITRLARLFWRTAYAKFG